MELSLTTSSWVSEQAQTVAMTCAGRALCSPAISSLAPFEVPASCPSRSFGISAIGHFKSEREARLGDLIYDLFNVPNCIMKQDMVRRSECTEPYLPAIRTAIRYAVELIQWNKQTTGASGALKLNPGNIFRLYHDSLLCSQLTSTVTQ